MKSAFAVLACASALAFSATPSEAQAAARSAPGKSSKAGAGKGAKAMVIPTVAKGNSSAARPRALGKAPPAHSARNALAARGDAARSAPVLRTTRKVRIVKVLAAGSAPVAVEFGARAGRRAAPVVRFDAPASLGSALGLKDSDDPLDLHSSVAYVVDQDSGETLFEKNSQAVLPIASITKLMTALVTLEARLALDEVLEITEAEIDTDKHTRSRLAVGTRLTRAEMLHLALMASENRASHALGRTYPGGLRAFVAAMNAKARALGMLDTVYNDPTGLSSRNQSNARDLVKLMRVAFKHPLIREYSTANDLTIDTGHREITFRSTNRLVREDSWDIGLQKTGFIRAAGNCLVMQARIDARRLWVVLLDARGGAARATDAWRLRRFIGDELRNSSTVKDRSPA